MIGWRSVCIVAITELLAEQGVVPDRVLFHFLRTRGGISAIGTIQLQDIQEFGPVSNICRGTYCLLKCLDF